MHSRLHGISLLSRAMVCSNASQQVLDHSFHRFGDRDLLVLEQRQGEK